MTEQGVCHTAGDLDVPTMLLPSKIHDSPLHAAKTSRGSPCRLKSSPVQGKDQLTFISTAASAHLLSIKCDVIRAEPAGSWSGIHAAVHQCVSHVRELDVRDSSSPGTPTFLPLGIWLAIKTCAPS